MNCTDLHFELHVTDLTAARRFYVDQLGLPVLQDTPELKLLAIRVGDSRMSIFEKRNDSSRAAHSHVILAVSDLEASISEVKAQGVEVSGPPVTAGDFLRFVTVSDPDGNTVALSEYLRNPLTPV